MPPSPEDEEEVVGSFPFSFLSSPEAGCAGCAGGPCSCPRFGPGASTPAVGARTPARFGAGLGRPVHLGSFGRPALAGSFAGSPPWLPVLEKSWRKKKHQNKSFTPVLSSHL